MTGPLMRWRRGGGAAHCGDVGALFVDPRLGGQAVVRPVGSGLRGWTDSIGRLTGGRFVALRTASAGLPSMLLTTTGRKTGQRAQPRRCCSRRTVTRSSSSAPTGGKQHHPAWSGNLLAHPAATVDLGGRHIPVRASLVDGEERARSAAAAAASVAGVRHLYERGGRSRPAHLPPRAGRRAPRRAARRRYARSAGPLLASARPSIDAAAGRASRVDHRVRLADDVSTLDVRDLAVRQQHRTQAGPAGAVDVVERPVADKDAPGRIGRRRRPPWRSGTPPGAALSTESRRCRRHRR